MQDPQISVIIPTYNRQHCLPHAVKSVLGQDFENFEIIVVDDASTDGTGQIGLELMDPRIRYIRLPERVGAQAARNQGLALSRSDLVCFLDSDDLMLPRSLSVRFRHFQDHPDCECSYSDYEVSFSGLRNLLIKKVSLADIEPPALYRRVLTQLKLAPVIVIMARRESILEIGGFDPSLPASHDDDLYIQFSRRGRCHHIPVYAARIVHQPGEAITGNPLNLASGKQLLIEKHRQLIVDMLGRNGLQRHYVANSFDFLLAADRAGFRGCFHRAKATGPLRISVVARVFAIRGSVTLARAARNALFALIVAASQGWSENTGRQDDRDRFP